MPQLFKDYNLYPPVFLAPMAGITDTPSRQIAQLFNPGLVVSEMIASSDKNKNYFTKVVKSSLVTPGNSKPRCTTAIQIAGSEVEWMQFAAKVVENEGGKIVDINMGCPAKKIVGRLAGSALMREPKKAIHLIDSVVKSVNIPVTLKMRLGWDETNLNALEIAKAAEHCGIKMITVHARTRCQFFKGVAEWKSVREIKESVSIPVIINGDIVDISSAKRALDLSNADGLMIGRGAIGKPWLIEEIASSAYNIKKSHNNISLNNIVNKHLRKIINFYGSEIGIKIFRKHLAGYLKHLEINKELRKKLMIETSVSILSQEIDYHFQNVGEIN